MDSYWVGAVPNLSLKSPTQTLLLYVVPLWLVYHNPLPKSHNKPKKELHWSTRLSLKLEAATRRHFAVPGAINGGPAEELLGAEPVKTRWLGIRVWGLGIRV